ncbi:MAG TPA: hypothetical protein VKT31_10595 [Solirubrobacteraceae bacterium]|nr:hypothetical protein [Solirubrobacteraceae bacterium]
MSGADQMVLLIAGLHLFALVCVALLILPALRDVDERPPGGSDADDGGGRGPGGPRLIPPRPRGGLPLPDAIPAGVRLRDHNRLGDHLPARERRPVREPSPRTPTRTPV